MYFLTTFFFTSFAFFIPSFFVFNEYIFAIKPTNSSIIFPFNSSFILPITFFGFIIIEWTFFLVPRKIEQLLISIKVFVHVNCLNLIHERICIGKQQRQVWILSLDVTVVEIIHRRFRKIQDGESHIDRSVQR